MAPVGMVSSMSWFGPLMFLVSAVAFLILSILLITLCTNCQKKHSNDYNMKQTKGNLNGNAEMNGGGSKPDGVVIANWKDHNNMPPNTLERSKTRYSQSQPESTEH
ncbi:hypothetical protein OJAV_G00231520 [Oryzias javanicus]|uniref:Uncharacterized protein n=1 Tax=Oryzias javanicus TaxID=123683 RepID=A0A3S2NTE7_ORYJA|nr:hypothetical protein OJAV_G00231520 [Oryzias javanicus]